MKASTGVKRLDELLDGGLPKGSATLVYGPPFIGKEVLTRLFLLAGMRQGVPGVLLSTGAGAGELRAHLAGLDPRYPSYEEAGLARYVDAYSRSVGGEEPFPAAEYVDSPLNLNALSVAVNNVQAQVLGKGPEHRFVFDSVSTLVAFSNPQTVFRFLQVFIGKTKRAGATTLLLLEKGMHTDAEVQMFKHLMDGVLEVKAENTKYLLHVEGIGVTEDRGWVEYRFNEKLLELTGSFAVGRIR
jgi:KaiC/GvpD/RAD55 family RecA-like ATPase